MRAQRCHHVEPADRLHHHVPRGRLQFVRGLLHRLHRRGRGRRRGARRHRRGCGAPSARTRLAILGCPLRPGVRRPLPCVATGARCWSRPRCPPTARRTPKTAPWTNANPSCVLRASSFRVSAAIPRRRARGPQPCSRLCTLELTRPSRTRADCGRRHRHRAAQRDARPQAGSPPRRVRGAGLGALRERAGCARAALLRALRTALTAAPASACRHSVLLQPRHARESLVRGWRCAAYRVDALNVREPRARAGSRPLASSDRPLRTHATAPPSPPLREPESCGT